MNVFIATPTAGHIVTTAYVHSILAATQAFHAAGWQYRHMVFDSADVELARNFFAAQMLKDERLTHLLFLDSDMLVEKPVFDRMIATGHPVVGAIYPERSIDWRVYNDLIRSGATEATATAAAVNFNVRLDSDVLDVRGGWCRVAGLGTGCLMIWRDVFKSLARSGAAPRIKSRKLQERLGDGELHDFFGRIEIEDGDRLGEDYSFCQRATEAGYDIWGLADMAVGHIGRHAYSARFVDYLNHAATAQALPGAQS